jgi:hypothetical protein
MSDLISNLEKLGDELASAITPRATSAITSVAMTSSRPGGRR